MPYESEQDVNRRENRERIVAYFEGGIAQPDAPQKLGVEVEHFVVQDYRSQPISYKGRNGLPGVQDVLEYLKRWFPQETRNAQGHLLGLANDTGSITLEPAAQLEISIAPYQNVGDVAAAYQAFRNRVDPYLARFGCHIACYGYHPSAHALDLPLIPKDRYRFMNEHFARIGSHGERMMRASASTQVSIDYYSEEDAVRKMRVATALGPIFAFITDNIPIFEGAPSPTPLDRLNLWRDVDNRRCGAVPGIFSDGFGFGAYADWMLATPPIFVTRPSAADPNGPALRAFGTTPAADAYADAPMEKGDIEHLISMFWPDVRLKHFVEIRQADCLPADEVYGYTALIKGLFYSEKSLAGIEQALDVRGGVWPLDDESVNRAIAAIRARGWQAIVYGKPVAEWTALLFGLAEGALNAEEAAYLPALRTRSASARTSKRPPVRLAG